MGPKHVPAAGRDPEQVRAELEGRGLALHSWSNGPDYSYAWHDHGYHKTLICLAGSIVFHTDDGDVSLSAGDVLELGPGPAMPPPSAPTASAAPKLRPDNRQKPPGRRAHEGDEPDKPLRAGQRAASGRIVTNRLLP